MLITYCILRDLKERYLAERFIYIGCFSMHLFRQILRSILNAFLNAISSPLIFNFMLHSPSVLLVDIMLYVVINIAFNFLVNIFNFFVNN